SAAADDLDLGHELEGKRLVEIDAGNAARVFDPQFCTVGGDVSCVALKYAGHRIQQMSPLAGEAAQMRREAAELVDVGGGAVARPIGKAGPPHLPVRRAGLCDR